MSSSFVIPAKLRRILIHVYNNASDGPRHSETPDLQLRLLVCQTTKLRAIAGAVARGLSRRHREEWSVSKILDRYGDEFVDPAETVWGALELMPLCMIKALPQAEEGKPSGLHARNAQEDKPLLSSQDAGENEEDIHANLVPASTINACQTGYYRLIDRHAADERPDISGVESSPKATPTLQAQSEYSQSTDRIGEQQNLDPADPLVWAEYETESSSGVVTTQLPDAQGHLSFAPHESPTQVIEPDTFQRVFSSSPPYDEEKFRPPKRKPMSLTPIRVRGKRHNKPKQESSENVEAAQERSRQEREYDAIIDANLRRAREEAERQTSASKMERGPEFMRSLCTPPAASPDYLSSSPSDIASSPTARVANNRHNQVQLRISQSPLARTRYESGWMDSYQNDSEMPSSPTARAGWDTSHHRVHFDKDEHNTEDQLHAGRYGTHMIQQHPTDSLPAWTDVVDDLLESTVSVSHGSGGRQPKLEHRSTLNGVESHQPEHHAELRTSRSGNTRAFEQQMAKRLSDPMWATGQKRKRYAAVSTGSRLGLSCENKNSPDHTGSTGYHQLHQYSDGASEKHDPKKSRTKEMTAR